MSEQQQVSGLAATMTIVAMGLGYSITAGDPTILAANLAEVKQGLQFTSSTGSFLACLATLTLAAAVLGAGSLGDRYGMKRMFVIGTCGSIAFGLLAVAAPNTAVLIVARAGVGIAFAFVLGLSLAIVNAVFPPGRRAGAIALYLGAGHAFSVFQPALGGILASHFGWRACFLVTPVLAAVTLLITLRYVPETIRAHRNLDIVGVLLIATGLIALIYGLTQLQNGFHTTAVVQVVAGLALVGAFLLWEIRTDEPALDLRIFRSGRFTAALTAGATFNFLQGGATILFAYYLVTVRGESPELLGLLLIPAVLLASVAAAVAGRAVAVMGERAVLVSGLVILLVGMVMFYVLDMQTPLLVVGIALSLNTIGGAVVQTPQSTIMMSSAPPGLGGVVSAVKPAVGQASYSMGPALFALVGTTLFLRDAHRKLADSGITEEQARDALRVAHGGVPAPSGSEVLDPEKARWVVSEAAGSMLDAIHTLSLVMAVVPAAAIVVAVLLIKPSRADRAPADVTAPHGP
ncbi:MFS transporter [Mycolicibacterium cyprinidarum]|uniref:MFS transporter n=1 Tax=Mycolicibacterium cyprinidarum TaxID=2860311 RepID=A0ABQ4VA88_9MYCO|nr:MFS transporter [Mycolicibacterium sp. NGTWS0302]GJF16158.1 MFS transporter [Mycolicibacterium sp. NGTWSNA01]GJF16976.1 MFS transporter [Mycolicibacterium sp. NGTWS1803]